MIYKRHYVQFNDFVIEDYELLSEDDSSAAFKYEDTSYTYSHGAYSPKKSEYGLVQATNVSMTIRLRMKALLCEYRPFYRRFVVSQLARNGRLWAVQDNTLVWAFASISNYTESQNSRKDELEIDVNFRLPEGIWHKADKQRTFLVPWDKCDFMECYDFKEVEPCFTGDCCNCDAKQMEAEESCDCCECLSKDMALCFHTSEIQSFYECHSHYRIVYDCNAADRFFGDFLSADHLGQKFCTDTGIIAGRLYSDTDIPTSGITITFHGPVKNPYIEINGNGNVINVEHDGILVVNPDGSVTYGNECAICGTLPVSAWEVPDGMSYGWEVHQGNNRLVIHTGACECAFTCVYIQIDSLTI